jgi:hypothetical protein
MKAGSCRAARVGLLAVLLSWLAFDFALAHQICIDSTAPYARPGANFARCPQYNGLPTCISPSEESSKVQEPRYQNNGAGVPPVCTQALRSIACGACDAWSGHLFRAEGPGVALAAPKLCPGYCASLYTNCSQVPIAGSPFVNGAQTFTTIASLYPTSASFCDAFSDDVYCYRGVPFTVPPPKPFNSSMSICIEKSVAGGEPKANLQPIPGYSDLMLVGDLQGLIDIYVVDDTTPGSRFTRLTTLLDLRRRIRYGGEDGLLGVAMHKSFKTNGRFYVSFTCKGGRARCGRPGDTMVEEYRVQDPGNRNALQADPRTRRVIFKLRQPFPNHNGGQVLFSPDPAEPHLFVMIGDGGSEYDPGSRAVRP